MRDHAKVRPTIWTGETGRLLHGKKDAQILMFYLINNLHTNMAGIYWLPIMYASNETGLTVDEVRVAMGQLSDPDVNFAHYDARTEFVWVVNMASEQLDLKDDDSVMKPGDKRRPAVTRFLNAARKSPLHSRFVSHYEAKLGLEASASEGASKGLPGDEKGLVRGIRDPRVDPAPAPAPSSLSSGDLSAGAGGGARLPEPIAQPIPIRPEGAWTATRARTVFEGLWLQRYPGIFPTMGGKSVGGFHERVALLADTRGADPEALYRAALTEWLQKPRSDIERRAPYACFAHAWSELSMPAEGDPEAPEPVSLEGKLAAARQRLAKALNDGTPTRDIKPLADAVDELQSAVERATANGGRRGRC